MAPLGVVWRGGGVRVCVSVSAAGASGAGAVWSCVRAVMAGVCRYEKGVRWMPWRQEAMKDVARCEKPRGDASDR